MLDLKSRMISWIFLSFIVVYISIPVIPVVEYLVNKDYIAKNLCINKDKPKSCCKGKCHLIKQLNKTSPKTGNDKKELPNRLQFKQLQDFIVCKEYNSIVPQLKTQLLYSLLYPHSELHRTRVYIPPEA